MTVWDGLITPDEWAAQAEARRLVAARGDSRRQLTDATSMAATGLVDDDVAKLVQRVAEQMRPSDRIAFVAPSRWIDTKLVDRARKELRPANAMLFVELASACAWLPVNHALAAKTIEEMRSASSGHAST